MARVIEVRNKIKDDDVFYLIRNIDSPSVDDVKDYVDMTCTGLDLERYILSFQTTFLDVVKEEVSELSSSFTSMISDFVDVKLIHESHYAQQTYELEVAKSNIDKNREDNNENYRVFNYLKTERYRMTRLYHVIPPSFKENEIPEGGIQLLVGENDNPTYANVKTIRAHRIDITGEERNFWAVYPGDIIEVIGQKAIIPDNPDHKVNTSVEYRAIYRVTSAWNIAESVNDTIMNIPVQLKNSKYNNIEYAFDGTSVPGDLPGNVVDYVYGQFSIFPTLDVNRYQELLQVYNEFTNVSPIGATMPWFESSKYKEAPFISKYGVWEEVSTLKGMYLVGVGKIPNTTYEFRSVNSTYRNQTTAKPTGNGGKYTNTESNHTHTVSLSNAGSHSHVLGNGKYAGSGSDVKSSRSWHDDFRNGYQLSSKNLYPNPDFVQGGFIGPNNPKYIDTHTHNFTLQTGYNHTHTGFTNGWDTYNRMNSKSCLWLRKKEHPQYIKDMRSRLALLYGDDFDK